MALIGFVPVPDTSMEPTLRVGDHVLADKRAYAWGIPFTKRRIAQLGSPQPGDVAVFRYPPKDTIDYVKRVIGVPGDTVSYRGKRLAINGQPIATKPDGSATVPESRDPTRTLDRYRETLDGKSHAILIDPDQPPMRAPAGGFPGREGCRYDAEGFECKVPAGYYFVMGDNRDNSADSR